MQGRRQPWERPEERRRLGEPPSSGGSSRDTQLIFGGFLPSPACYDTSLSSKHRQKGGTGKPSLAWARRIGGRVPRFFLYFCAALVAAALVQLCIAKIGLAQEADISSVTLQPDPGPDVIPFYRDWTKGAEPRLSRKQTIERLRAVVKYVFVIFQENESFDNYFGTFPGANGIYSDGRQPRAPKDTPGFAQKYKSFATGELVAVEPFLIGPNENANAVDSVDHSHIGLARKLHVSGNVALMNQFALDEYSRFAVKGGTMNEARGKQFARLVSRMLIATPFHSFGNMPAGSFSSTIFFRPKIRPRHQTRLP
jgi:Phosphoesterase family